MQPFFVYMLRCSDGSYYTGHTDDLERRVNEHQLGVIPGHTSGRRPVELVWFAEMPSREEALEREMQVKRWVRRKKEALIVEDWPRVKQLARGPDRHAHSPFDSAPGATNAAPSGATLRANGVGSPTGAEPALSVASRQRGGVEVFGADGTRTYVRRPTE